MFVRLLLLSVGWLVLLIGVAWAFGALWFDFPGLSVASTSGGWLWAECDRSARVRATPLAGQLGVAGAITLLAAWWLTIPFQYGRLAAGGGRGAYAEIDGDRVVIHNFRNFDYVSKTDFRPRDRRFPNKLDFLGDKRDYSYLSLFPWRLSVSEIANTVPSPAKSDVESATNDRRSRKSPCCR